MAVLTSTELAEIRRQVAAGLATLGWTKTQINAALQACEDYYETTARTGFGTAMEAAAPGVFNAAAKKRIGAYWMLQKFFREGV